MTFSVLIKYLVLLSSVTAASCIRDAADTAELSPSFLLLLHPNLHSTLSLNKGAQQKYVLTLFNVKGFKPKNFAGIQFKLLGFIFIKSNTKQQHFCVEFLIRLMK